MRNLSDVIEKMLKTIPTEAQTLRSRLGALQRTSQYAAPEEQSRLWRGAQQILTSEIGKPTEKWQKEVANFFSGKT